MSKTKKILIAVLILAVLAGGAWLIWHANQPAAQAGAKTVTVEVVHADASKKDFTISTDEEFLRGALEQEGLAQGTESEYGLFITMVDGETADDSLQQWWCVTKGGAQVDTGVDTTPIADGDTYELTLKTGW